MKVMTNDGHEIDLSPLADNDSFKLGRKAAREGWGQEGGVLQKNGPIFRLAWFLNHNLREGMRISFSKQEVLEALVLAEQENVAKRAEEEREARLKPTGLHFIFVNPSSPLPPVFSWSIFLSWQMAKNFLADWLEILRSKCGWLPDGSQGFNAFSPGYAVCFTAEQIKETELLWIQNDLTTFRVDFTLDQGEARRGTLVQEEQNVLKFLVQTARNIEDEGGSDKAPDWFLHFRGQDMWQILLKGIKAERIWRAWLRNGRKGPRVVKAQ